MSSYLDFFWAQLGSAQKIKTGFAGQLDVTTKGTALKVVLRHLH